MSDAHLEAKITELENRISRHEQCVTTNMALARTDDADERDDDLVTGIGDVNRPYTKEIIAEIERSREHGAPVGLVVETLVDRGHDEEEAIHEIDRLRQMGEIYEPVTDFLKVV